MTRKIATSFIAYLILIQGLLFAASLPKGKDIESEKLYTELTKADWQEVFFDSCTKDWHDKWFLDGLRAKVTNTKRGMVFEAGPVHRDHSCHAVLWTKKSFAGDIKIEYDYTRIDTKARGDVNIIYIQATGIGKDPYVKDISKWSELREIPYMKVYLRNMNLLHISYAAFGSNAPKGADYVRGRYYPVTTSKNRFEPTYFNTGLFKPGVTYKITIIKKGNRLFFNVRGKNGSTLYNWDTSKYPQVKEGRIGLRHMWTRTSRYKNFKVSILKKSAK